MPHLGHGGKGNKSKSGLRDCWRTNDQQVEFILVSERFPKYQEGRLALTKPFMLNEQFYIPTEVFATAGRQPYMAYSHPVASDFFHPEFAAFLATIHHPFQMHRKLWEYAYIDHQLRKAGVIKSQSRGLCFGVGQEQLPAVFAAAGCVITATDAPSSIGEAWSGSREYSGQSRDLNFHGIISEEDFIEKVEFRICDMNAIDASLTGYDFCWSACCLEHRGNLRKGLDFIKKSIDTLNPGGVACHTTELNLSSNTDTVSEGATVLYRLQDLMAFEQEMRDLGHDIGTITVAAPATPIDHHVDVPPYSHNPHLKLLLGSYVSTSVGIVIRKRA